MSNLRKSAAFLIAIGSEAASEILRNLDEDTVMKITAEMSRIKALSPAEREEVIGDFMVSFNKIKDMSFGGEEFVKKLLIDSVGIEKAKKIVGKLDSVSPRESFEFLKHVDPEVISSLVAGEHPQTIAVLFSHIESSQAGSVMRLIDRTLAKDVAVRLAKMQQVSPEAVVQVAQTLKRKYEEMTSSQVSFDQPGGIDKIADIMNNLDAETEADIMKHFEAHIPDAAKEVSEKIYTFESVVLLSNFELRILIDELNDDQTLALALKGAGDEVRFKFMRNMSNNRATDILSDIDRMGPVRMSEILEARRHVVHIMRRLDNLGSIVLKKDREEYIE